MVSGTIWSRGIPYFSTFFYSHSFYCAVVLLIVEHSFFHVIFVSNKVITIQIFLLCVLIQNYYKLFYILKLFSINYYLWIASNTTVVGNINSSTDDHNIIISFHGLNYFKIILLFLFFRLQLLCINILNRN